MKLAVICALFASAIACDLPNNVATAFYSGSCSTTDKIRPLSIQVLNSDGSLNYPIDASKPLRLKTVSQDNYPKVINSINADVQLSAWSSSKCAWIEQNFINTFLKHLNGCSMGGNCPLSPGQITMDKVVDLSAFNWIIKLLGVGPYRLEIRLSEKDDSANTEVTCIDAQFMLKK